MCFQAILHEDIWKEAYGLKWGPPQSHGSLSEPSPCPSCLVGRRISCQHCIPNHSSIPASVSRKRSHKGRKIVNRSFKFDLFPEKKGVSGVWGDPLRALPAVEAFWNSSSLICLPVEATVALRPGGRTDTCRADLRSRTLLRAPMWSRLFFIFTPYEANGIYSWLTSNLEKWSSLRSQLAGLTQLVLLKWVRQQQVFAHKSRGLEKWVWEGESLGCSDSQQAHRRTGLASELQKCWCLDDKLNREPESS